MSALKKAFIAVVTLLIIVVAVGFTLPKEYVVKRSIVIKAPPQTIYSNVVDLKSWPKWGVWFKRDPAMEVTYEGPDRAIGMRSAWVSESEGSGQMEITDLEHNKKVVYSLYFPEFEMGSTGQFEIEPMGEEGTRVTWIDKGQVGNNPVERYFVLMMDDMIGPDFQKGLENLKTVSEHQS